MESGFTFGNYRLVRRLGRGGMAEVFLAVQSGPHNFERLVAIKSILPHLAENEQFVDLFMEEARLSAMLSHPNIAHIYDFGIVEGTHYITMEYIDGVDLRLVLRKQQTEPLPFEHAARIIADICGALHYAHSLCDSEGRHLNLVHRDISPHNILVAFNGAVKVVDFGLAKAAHHLDRTRPGMVRGKFTYMSPEQVTGQPLDGRSDIFCAGIVLYELCTNDTLLPRDDAMEAMRLIRSARFPRPLRQGLAIPAPLEQVLERSLARERAQRFTTAAEMQLELETYLRGAALMSNAVVLGDYFQQNYRVYRQPEDAEVTRIQQMSELHPWSQGRPSAGLGRDSSQEELPDHELAGDFPSLPAADLEPLPPRVADSSSMLPASALEPLPDSILEPLPERSAGPSPLLQALASTPQLDPFADESTAASSADQEQPFSDEASTLIGDERVGMRRVAPRTAPQPAGDDSYLVALLAGDRDSDASVSGSLTPRHWPTPAPLPPSEEQVIVNRAQGRSRWSWRRFSAQQLALAAMVGGLLAIASLVGYCVSTVPEPQANSSSDLSGAPPATAPAPPLQTTGRQELLPDSGADLAADVTPPVEAAATPAAAPATPAAARSQRRGKKPRRSSTRKKPRRDPSIIVEELPLD